MKISTILLFSILSYTTLIAQDKTLNSTCAAGDSFKNNSIQIDWNIGGIIGETFNSNNFILNHGFMQKRYIISSIDKIKGINLSLKAWPNPVREKLKLKIEDSNQYNWKNFILKIFDSKGKLLLKQKYLKNPMEIDFYKFKPNIYFVSIYNNQNCIKKFKIVKNN